MKKFGLVVFLLVGLLLVSACEGAAPEKAAPEKAAPEKAAPEEPAPEEPASAASIAKGGAMYDKWWKVAEGAVEPTEDHPLWSLQSTNTRSDSTTWRCKECHGWDYKGKDGAYSKGSHFTGFPGVYDAGTTKTKAELLAIMKGGNNKEHDFSAVMGESALQDMANFLKEGILDTGNYIDYNTKEAIGANVARGKELYTSNCAACHGIDGKQINFGTEAKPIYVGTYAAVKNPWEALHKARFGYPGTGMPSTVKLGWNIQDDVDVLGYSQTLPQ